MFSPAAVMDNPFQILSFILAPAIITNATSLLCMSTSNRFARILDRSRALYDKLKTPNTLSEEEKTLYKDQIAFLSRCSALVAKGLTWFFIAIASFVTTALISLFGAGVAFFHFEFVSEVVLVVAMLSGFVGFIGLIMGSSYLVREMWQAQHFLKLEVTLMAPFLK